MSIYVKTVELWRLLNRDNIRMTVSGWKYDDENVSVSFNFDENSLEITKKNDSFLSNVFMDLSSKKWPFPTFLEAKIIAPNNAVVYNDP